MSHPTFIGRDARAFAPFSKGGCSERPPVVLTGTVH